jgi:hypothetical protein
MNFRKKSFGRACGAAVVAVLATFASSGVAAADDVYNNLDATIDAEAEVMALTAGGSEGTTVLAVLPTGNGSNPADGKSGCNLTGSSTLEVTVSSSATAVATASLSNAVFTSCSDTKTITIDPLTEGSTTITVAQVSNSTGATFNFAPATFRVDVSSPAPTNTPPTVTVGGVAHGASYAKGSVPAATCEVTDAEDGDSSFAATLTGTLDSDGLGSQTASCSYTDEGGLQASSSATYAIIDPSAPVITYTLNPTDPDGLANWYTGTVTLTWNVSEPQSPNSLSKTDCVDQTISADQMETTYSCSATSSGGSSGPVDVKVKRDGNAPSVSYTSASPATPDGENGWYVSPVTATFTATDLFSGVAGSATGTDVSTTDGNAVTIPSPAFSDNAGNTRGAGATSSPAFKIDTTDPDVPDFSGGPTDDASYYFGSVPAAPTCTSDDETSLLKDCVVTGYSGAVGTHTLTATATDNAGNTSQDTVDYTVLAWTTKGFYSPVDMPTLLSAMPMNTVKGGSTVPLKFELFAGSTELTSVDSIASFKQQKINCVTNAAYDAIEVTSTGGTSLRYDATGGQFIQNWKTPTGAGNCYTATMTALDGSSITAYFKIK